MTREFLYIRASAKSTIGTCKCGFTYCESCECLLSDWLWWLCVFLSVNDGYCECQHAFPPLPLTFPSSNFLIWKLCPLLSVIPVSVSPVRFFLSSCAFGFFFAVASGVLLFSHAQTMIEMQFNWACQDSAFILFFIYFPR